MCGGAMIVLSLIYIGPVRGPPIRSSLVGRVTPFAPCRTERKVSRRVFVLSRLRGRCVVFDIGVVRGLKQHHTA